MTKFCPDAQHGLYVRRLTPTTASIGFCCLSGINDTVEQIDFDHDANLSLRRKKFAHDPESVAECGKCWYVEKNGGTSRRQSIIHWYNDREVLPAPEPSLNKPGL